MIPLQRPFVLAPGNRSTDFTGVKQKAIKTWTYYFFGIIFLMPILWITALPNVPTEHLALASLLLIICTLPTVLQLANNKNGLPVFPMLCLIYATGYAIPIFYAEPFVASVSRYGFQRIYGDEMTKTLWLCNLGVASMQLGFSFFNISIVHFFIPRIRLELDQRKGIKLATISGFFGAFLLWGGLTSRLPIPPSVFVIFGLLSRMSSLGLALLYWYYLRGILVAYQKAIFWSLLLFMSFLGLGTGNLRQVFDPFLILAAVYWMVNRRLPMKFILIGAVAFGILQPLKGDYRVAVWYEKEASGSIIQRASIWGNLFAKEWSSLLSGQRSLLKSKDRNAPNTLSRTDFVHMFGHVVGMTPRYVPYQYGSTYSYLLYALVPRFLWLNKPGAQTANEFFGVAYGFQDPKSIGITSIGAPHLVETYINFGAPGVFFIMMIIGIIYAIIDRMFNHPEAGEGSIAIYATIMSGIFLIETAAAPTFGALFQTLAIYIVIVRWARIRNPLKRMRPLPD